MKRTTTTFSHLSPAPFSVKKRNKTKQEKKAVLKFPQGLLHTPPEHLELHTRKKEDKNEFPKSKKK